MVKNSDNKALGISCTSPGITKPYSINHSPVLQLWTHTCSGNNSPEGTVTSHRLLRANGTLMTSLLSTTAALGGETKRKEYFRTCTKRGRIWRFPSLGWLINEPTHWKRSWCWESLKAGREGDDRGRDDWMVSLIQWTQVWVNSRRWWRTGKLGMLQSMGSQTVGNDWANE